MLSCFRAVPLVGYTAFHKGFYAMGHLPWWRSIHTGITQQFSLTPNCHTIAGRHLGRIHLCLFRPLPCHSIVLRFPDNPARVSCETNFAVNRLHRRPGPCNGQAREERQICGRRQVVPNVRGFKLLHGSFDRGRRGLSPHQPYWPPRNTPATFWLISNQGCGTAKINTSTSAFALTRKT